jgi:N utilization substance protein B
VDRALLRIAVTELIARPEIPAAVVIDEAVELAKVYSTALSGSYLNGVLGAVARETRPAGELSSPARCPAEVPSGP